MNELDNAIARLRKIHDNPSPHPDDVRLDVEGTIYELLAVKARAEAAEREVETMRRNTEAALAAVPKWMEAAEAAEADARRYRWLRKNGQRQGKVAELYCEDDLDAAIDAELAKEAK